MLKIKAKNKGRADAQEICACHREIAGVGHIVYSIVRESGRSRAIYGTPCTSFYTLIIKTERALCRLPDVAREKEVALSLCARFAEGAVLPANAVEIYEDLCLA